MAIARRRGIIGGALVALLMSGCTTGAPSDSDPPETATSDAPAAPTADPSATNTSADDAHPAATATGSPGPNEAQLLGEGEIPGFTVTGKGDLEMAGAQAENVAAQIAAISVQPSTCQELITSLLSAPAVIYQALDYGSVQGFSSTAGQLMAEAIASGTPAEQLVVDTAGIDACAAVTITQGGMTAQVDVVPIAPPLGDASSGAFLTQTINAGGAPIITVTASVAISKGDSVVALTLTGQAADPAALKQTFEAAATKAFTKAEPAL